MKRAAIGLAVAAALAAGSARAGTVERSTSAGRPVRVFVPAKPASPAAAVLMLHGCTQKADGFAEATRMDAVAEESGFYAIYVEQPDTIQAGRCWQWFDAKHQARGAGEPKDLTEVVKGVVTAKGIDPDRVYVAGLSAGAAMSVILGATYPDVFTAIGVVAGAPYASATSFTETYAVSQSGSPDPAKLGDLAKAAMGSYARAVPTMVFHGTADGLLNVKNGRDVADQWVRTNGLVLGDGTLAAPTTKAGTANGYGTTTTTHRQASNNGTVVELVIVEGLGHAWPGGLAGGSYSDERGPDASRALWAFFAPRTKSAALPEGKAPEASTEDPGFGTPVGDAGASGDPSQSGSAAPADEGGCAVSRAKAAPSLAGLALVALTALAARARRRRA